MANQEYVDILKQGVDKWNKWRKRNSRITPSLIRADLQGASLQGADLRGVSLLSADLSKADLSEADLQGADLQMAELEGTDFWSADLSKANLDEAYLHRANLKEAKLSEANLRGAVLMGTDLWRANLNETDFRGADLSKANLSEANLHEANLKETSLHRARFGHNFLSELDLSKTSGLKTIKHTGYSYLHQSTIIKSKGKLPIEFLRGCGLLDWEIESCKLFNKELSDFNISEITNKIFELRSGPAIHYCSCFISYSSLNQYFADKVHDTLQDTGVRCWFDKKSLKTGNRLKKTITDSIRIHDKLLLILSQESIKAPWVKFEVDKALDRELREDREILFPILIEDIPITYDNWMETILHERHYLDFRNWEDETSWNQSFEKLLKDLKN